MIKLLKTNSFAALLAQNKPITKKDLLTEEVATYRENLCKKARQIYVDSKMLVEEDEGVLYEAPDKKQSKKEKKPTIEITHDLWKLHKSVEKVAEIRKLTRSTIQTHFVKLIQSKLLRLDEVMSDERISFLKGHFEKYPDASNS